MYEEGIVCTSVLAELKLERLPFWIVCCLSSYTKGKKDIIGFVGMSVSEV